MGAGRTGTGQRPGRTYWPAGVAARLSVLGGALALYWVAAVAWIPAKAALAQYLLQRSWQQVLAGHADSRPWPWADTRPAAVLRVPQLGIRQYVLEGNSGRNLAFGPVLGGSLQGSHDRIISGHRDTHFSFVQYLRPDQRLWLETPDGAEQYRVISQEIIDSRQQELVLEPSLKRLSLVTCYPFDALTAGGPLRYVVTAVPVQRQLASITAAANPPPAASSG